MTRPARILVLRGGAIGDFIVTLPALQALRTRWPDGYIELVGYPHIANLAAVAGIVNRVRSLDEARIARFFSPHAVPGEDEQRHIASFDIILNYLHDPEHILHDNLKRCGAQVLISHPPLVTGIHAADHFLKALESLAIYDADPVPRLTIAPGAAPHPTRANRIAIHPGSGGRSKIWPLERFLAIAHKARVEQDLEPVFLTGDADIEYIPGLKSALEVFERHHNLPLIDAAALLGSCSVYLGNDSGITHLAAATGCPSLALFGPSDPGLWAPRGSKVDVIRSPDATMDGISIDDVYRQLTALHPS